MRSTLSLLVLITILAAESWMLVRSSTFAAATVGDHSSVSLRSSAARSSTAAAKPNFDSEIKPIFQARCQPCHFQGGKVYDKLPFDKAETITRLGPKLFTRIKDEKEQQKIREFLGQQ
jgi:cytochrome c5